MPQIDPEVIKKTKDVALRAMNSIRYYKMGKPIAPVWPRCPNCGGFCTADQLFTTAQTGLCRKCSEGT